MLVRIAALWSMYFDSVSEFLEYWRKMDVMDYHLMEIDEIRFQLVVVLHQILKRRDTVMNGTFSEILSSTLHCNKNENKNLV